MPFLNLQNLKKKIFHITILNLNFEFPAHNTVNSRFKTDLKLQIHLNKTFFLDDQFLDSLYKSNNSRFKKGKMDFLKSRVYFSQQVIQILGSR